MVAGSEGCRPVRRLVQSPVTRSLVGSVSAVMRYEPGMNDRIEIRRANSGDSDFVAGLASSLLEFGSPV